MRTYYFWCIGPDGRRFEDRLCAVDDEDFRARLPGHLAARERTLPPGEIILWQEWGTVVLEEPGT